MKRGNRPWRKIVHRFTRWKERTTLRGRTFSWSRSEVHTLTLECGHTQERGGSYVPKYEVVCRLCEAGEAPVPLEPGLEGVTDVRQSEPGDAIARALLGKETA